MAKKHRFVARSQIHATAEDVFRWHAEPGALEKLTPPCEPVEVEQRAPGIRNGDRGALRVPLARSAFAGFLSTATTSRDANSKMSRFPALSPMGTHPFTPKSLGVCVPEDLIDYDLPLGALGNFLAAWIVRRKLKELFAFRHRVTAEALWPSHSKNPRRLIESPNEQVSHVSEPQDAFETSAILSHTVTYGTPIAPVSFRFAECALDSIRAA